MTDSVDVKTYSDDKCFGQKAPSLELLEAIQGEKIDLQPGKVHVLYFFTTFYKGAYPVNEEFTKLSEKYTDVNFISISNDAEKEKLERFLQKLILDDKHNTPIRMKTPFIMYDDKKATAKLYADVSNLSVMSCPMAFIVDKDGKIQWRQQFLQTYTVKDSNFEAQLLHVINGEELESNGPRPVVDAGEGEEAECDDMSFF